MLKKFKFFAIIMALVACVTFGLFAVGCANSGTVDVKITAIDKELYVGEEFDFKSLFTLTVDGQKVTITDEMLDLGDLTSTSPAGEYKVKLTYTAADGETHFNVTTVKIIEYNDNAVEVLIDTKNVYLSKGSKFFAYMAFAMRVDNTPIAVTNEMVDLSDLDTSSAGDYTVKFSYTDANATVHERETTVTVQEITNAITPAAKSVVAWSDEPINGLLKKAFTIQDGEAVTVTRDMIVDWGGLNPDSLTAGTFSIECAYFAKDNVWHTATATLSIGWAIGPY